MQGSAPGTIIDQNPAAGTTQNKGAPLKIKFDPGVQVPEVKGSQLTAAINAIVGASLTPGTITTQCDASIPENQVINQDPPAGAQKPSNTPVTMTIASRPAVVGRPCFRRIFRAQDVMRIDGIRMERMRRIPTSPSQ